MKLNKTRRRIKEYFENGWSREQIQEYLIHPNGKKISMEYIVECTTEQNEKKIIDKSNYRPIPKYTNLKTDEQLINGTQYKYEEVKNELPEEKHEKTVFSDQRFIEQIRRRWAKSIRLPEMEKVH